MKHFLKFTIPAIFAGLVIAGAAHAQVASPNFWRTNVPSSTITPINASLQVPCANIVGGCGGGGVATGSVATLGSPLTIGGSQSSSITGNGTASLVPNLDNVLFADGYSGSDIGAKINAAIAASTPSPIIIVTASSSFSTPISVTTKFPLIECSPGANLQYTGPTSTPAITFNAGTGSKYQWGLIGCHFSGSGQFNGQTGLLIGGSAGADSITIQGNQFTGFALGGEATARVNWMNISYNTFSFDVTAWDWIGGAGSGEQVRYIGNTFADCNNPVNCVENPGGYSSVLYAWNSIDDAQLSFGNNIGFGVTLDHNHFEPPAALTNGNYGAYVMLSLASDTAASVSEFGDVFVTDAQTTTSTPKSLIVNNTNLLQSGVAYFNNALTKVTNAIDISGSANATVQQQGDVNELGAFINFTSSTNATTQLAAQNLIQSPVATTSVAMVQLGSGQFTGNSANGTMWAISAPGSYSGDLINVELNGAERFLLQNSGKLITYGDNSFENGNSFFDNALQIDSGAGNSFHGQGTGAGYYAGTWTVGSTTAGTAALNVNAPSSTARIGLSGQTSHGCIELYDAVNSSTVNYLFVSSTALVVTASKPAFCQ